MNLVGLIQNMSRFDIIGVILNTVWFQKKTRASFKNWPIAALQQKCYEVLIIMGEVVVVTDDKDVAEKWRDEKLEIFPASLADRPACNRPRDDQFIECGTDSAGRWVPVEME